MKKKECVLPEGNELKHLVASWFYFRSELAKVEGGGGGGGRGGEIAMGQNLH